MRYRVLFVTMRRIPVLSPCYRAWLAWTYDTSVMTNRALLAECGSVADVREHLQLIAVNHKIGHMGRSSIILSLQQIMNSCSSSSSFAVEVEATHSSCAFYACEPFCHGMVVYN